MFLSLQKQVCTPIETTIKIQCTVIEPDLRLLYKQFYTNVETGLYD